ncbi:ATP phosphoribosyltransferase regulatory subunit [Erwinia amylovora]|uniref:ATP phosphoribosyltransferase regulatory subunit n=1 Tax=Erwinia amylovora TaxID=552 RepID=UPI001444877E|nr:ATP phosphoribosyltransferase regulatory subunit [Erwinia amylovora]
MSSNGFEYLRLPKGFHVRGEKYLDVYLKSLLRLTEISRSCGYESVVLPSLGFQSTFGRAANVLGDKTFEFLDRKGRNVLMSPDSTAGLLRWHAESRTMNDCSKISWFAPVFRYRNVENRGFHQIGFSAINWFHNPQDIDWPLIDLSNNLLDLIRGVLDEPGSVKINNVGAIKRTITSLLSLSDSKELIAKLMKEKSSAGKIELLTVSLPDSDEKLALLSIFGATARLNKGATNLVLEMQKDMHNFADKLKNVDKIAFALDNLHSSEIVSGIGIEFYTANGARIGDGGRYDEYAKIFDSRCQTLVSVCSGIEAFFRNINSYNEPHPNIDLAIICFPEAQSLLKDCVYQLRNKNIRVEEIPLLGKIKGAISKVKQKAKYYCIIGNDEMRDAHFIVHNSTGDYSEKISLNMAQSRLFEIISGQK